MQFVSRPVRASRGLVRRILARVGVGTLVAVVLPFLAVFLWLRLYGLPDSVKESVMSAIERRHIFPYPVSVQRFFLDATGAILADGVTVFRDANRQSVMLQVDRVRISVAWLGWWRGRGIVEGATISNAEVRYPVGPHDTANFSEVNAHVSINGRDIKIESAQAHFLDLAIYVRGTIHNNGFPKHQPPTAEQLRQREALWRSLLKAVDDVGVEAPIDVQLEFETSTQDLGAGRANFNLEGQHLTWRTAPVEELSLHGSLNRGLLSLDDFRIGLQRGDLTAYGEWNIDQHAAEIQFASSMDFTSLAPAFSGPLGETLRRLDFPNAVPSVTGRIQLDLHQGVHSDLQADLDWRDFTFNGVAFSRLTVPLAYDGKRLLVPGLKIEGAAGNIDLELFFDSTKVPANLNGKITSTLDPTILKGVFGAKMDNFLSSCSFAGGGPKIEATATGIALKTDAWTVTGKLATGQFVYKTASFKSATSDFTFADGKLDLPDLAVTRPEGNGGGTIIYDFKNRSVELHNLITQVNVAEVAPIMGPKFTAYTKPYHFARPPLVRANGKVDLQDQKKELDTDLLVEVEARTPMEWTLFHVPFSFDNPNGTLAFKNRRLTVNMKQCGFYDGALTGTLDMNLRQSPAAYVLDLNLAKVDFKKFMVRVFNYEKSTGQLTTGGRFTGVIGDMASLDGKGEVKVDHGDIAAIPLLGSLTPLIPGLSQADAAHSDFTAAKGVIHTDDLHISSETLALLGTGNYNFVTDDVDLNMRVNTNVPMIGLLLYPVSKIFEFHGTGHMKDVKWSPKNL